jgi:hypothetical protein
LSGPAKLSILIGVANALIDFEIQRTDMDAKVEPMAM